MATEKYTDRRHEPADAIDHEHTYGERWFPLDKWHIRRVCVIPGCGERQVRKATA